ncbi:MAG TPA: dihydroorotate dehydrogenase electron transfer subunit [Ruminococcaceae bacterium]|nr:dihydroorotate dehydrogenase electron transfer subunit [Oscillospiraceae bacterium]
MAYLQGEFPIIARTKLAENIFDYTIGCPQVAEQAKAGQFVHIKADGFMLRRPISICEIDKTKGTIRIVFEIRGSGTDEIAKLNAGGKIDMLAPLGNGFELLDRAKKAIVIGGGIGVPPMVEAAKHYGKNAAAIIGFRNADAVILEEDFINCGCETLLTTDDGSKGKKGFVSDALAEYLKNSSADIIYACGPKPMLYAINEIAKQHNIRLQVSLEERMACGVGACLGCACKAKKEDGTETYKHVCKDGPVFEAEEVLL